MLVVPLNSPMHGHASIYKNMFGPVPANQRQTGMLPFNYGWLPPVNLMFSDCKPDMIEGTIQSFDLEKHQL